ncbi:unnamed protein product [Phytophthora lilii]|uniref:Anaphase-promoting complex subunit 4 n=1 Tax=Phytophthora lilii TaxID=2077276 RepID=A0A9W6THI7_9STRA|nr:unnamed protein product [Phytophthora lilii]
MMTLAWKPDGLQLAVGCDEGDVAVFEIESGEALPERRSNFRHEHCITAMHWTEICDVEVAGNAHSNHKRRRKVEASRVDRAMSQSKLQFQRRSSRFLAGYSEKATSGDTVLVSADERGFIALWWMGRVLLTRLDVSSYFSDEEYQILGSMGYQRGEHCSNGFRIERVDLAPDLSVLFVLLAFYCNDSETTARLSRMLTINLTAIQRIHEDVALVSSTVDHVDTILNRIAVAGKQMVSEWKNATRIFELKMSLIGSLYEKYACEDPPQVDMLSAAVTGITTPALAQYFAQDIQEMSVLRMQKALFSGCDTLRNIVEDKLKRDLVELLFLLSELRGHAKWSPQAYMNVLGITVASLDNLVSITHETIVEMESFMLAIYRTRQDFALFFRWILERIHIHTNTTRDTPGGCSRSASSAVHDSKSLLDLRGLCDFLQRAADAARRFQKHQPVHNRYKVETTFGNEVSRKLSAQRDKNGKPAVECLGLTKSIQDQWIAVLDSVATTLAKSMDLNQSGCFTFGTRNNLLKECHIRFRRSLKADGVTSDCQSDDGDEDEAVDWDSLKYFGPTQDTHESRNTVLIGLRLQTGVLVLMRAKQDVDSETSELLWDIAQLTFSRNSSRKTICQGFDYYGDAISGKAEQLAFVLDCEKENSHEAPSRLAVFDAEDSEDDDDSGQEDEDNDGDTSD